MPANLPPEYFEVERRYREAKTIEEKLFFLERMLAVMPKHKGTEKLQKELRTKLSKLRNSLFKRPATRRGFAYHIPKEGAGQVVIVGPPNSGKSSLLKCLTNAKPEIAPYPFTTQTPQVGMMEYEDIKIQLVDTPPISERNQKIPWKSLIYNADLLLLVMDLGKDNILEELGLIKEIIYNPKQLLLGNKLDQEGVEARLNMLKKNYPVMGISCKTCEGLEDLKREIFKSLEIIRIYTKKPGKSVERIDPLILKKGSTLLEAARETHKDFEHLLKYARLWNDEYSGQRVERQYILKDRDVVEFHTR